MRAVPALTIIWHPVAQRAGEQLFLHALATGGEVLVSRRAPDFRKSGKVAAAPLGDPSISRTPIHFTATPGGGVEVRSEGTSIVWSQGPARHVKISREELARGVPLTLADRVVLLLHLSEPPESDPGPDLDMVGQSPQIRRVRSQILQVADLPHSVLIRGETGTGKERVATAIQAKSPRARGPFVTVNLGGIAKDLAAGELFGVESGAATNVRARPGHFQQAHQGTLFLDELGETPPDVQVMLLRALETSEVVRVGATSPTKVDIRLIAATDANLEDLIARGEFKEPLLHRIAGYEIRLPPLRERREDLGPLILHFARAELERIGEAHLLDGTNPAADPWLPAALVMRMLEFDWPGNIRQLRNFISKIAISNRGRATVKLDPQLLAELRPGGAPAARSPDPPASSLPPPSSPASLPPSPPAGQRARRKPSSLTPEEVREALRAARWELNAAAEILGIPRSSIYDIPGVRKAGDLTAEEIEECYRQTGGDLDAMVDRLEVSARALLRRMNELGLVPQGRKKKPRS